MVPEHWFAHRLPEQNRPLAQGLSQPPQLAGSLLNVTQDEPHLVVPPTHFRPQVPAEQTLLIGHTNPHMPQLAGSTLVFTQALPHFVGPPTQLRAHAPAEHT